jgi:hypothetical protein
VAATTSGTTAADRTTGVGAATAGAGATAARAVPPPDQVPARISSKVRRRTSTGATPFCTPSFTAAA